MKIQSRSTCIISFMLAGCAAPMAAHSPKLAAPAVVVAPPELTAGLTAAPAYLPPPRRLVDTPGAGTLTGTVSLAVLSDPFFKDSAASFQLLSSPAAHALIGVTTLDDSTFGKSGLPLTATSDATGAFRLTGVPTDRPFIVTAQLAGDHRLAALVAAGGASTALDEATTMVVEQARWQLPATPKGLDAATLDHLAALTRQVLKPADLASHGTLPTVPALKSGQGFALRNAYVSAFAGLTTKAGATPADQLSDLWLGLLGVRPLALSPVPNVDPATLKADDAVMAASGGLFVAPHANFLIYIPARDQAALPGSTAALTAGKAYAIAGQVNGGDGPGTLDAYNALYHPIELAAVTDPASAPFASQGASVWLPFRLWSEEVAASAMPHLFFTSRQGHRLYFIPGSDCTRYGRSFIAGRLYTLAGYGAVEAHGATGETEPLGDGGPAYQAPLVDPEGIAQTAGHDLLLTDTGGLIKDMAAADPLATLSAPLANGRIRNTYHQSVRVIRASDGHIFTCHLGYNGKPYPLLGAQDLRVATVNGQQLVYVTDSFQHCVVSFPLPALTDAADAGLGAPLPVSIVLGQPGRAGQAPTGDALTLDTLDAGVAASRILLDTPTALELDAQGRLLVADRGHIRLLDQGQVYTLAGALDGGFGAGDARLVPTQARYLTRQAGTDDLILPDAISGAVLRLGLGRSAR